VSSVSAAPVRVGRLREHAAIRTWVLAGSLVAVTVAACWLLSDVSVGEAARFAGFEAGFCVLPGCMLYVALSPEPGGWLRTLAVGWPCGYALEVGAFAATAALHVRPLFAFLPLFATLTIGPLAFVRLRGHVAAIGDEGWLPEGIRRGDGRDALLVAGALVVALLVLAFTFFAPAPLPGHARSVVYGVDNVFDISIAAEALHHWPITEPWVSGHALHYYTGAFIHMAAINQVTGVPLATIVLRFFPSVMFLLVALQLWSLGSATGRSRWAGPVAVVLLLVIEDINLDPLHIEVLHVNPFNQFPLSPSFAFGATFMLALLLLVQSWLPADRPPAVERLTSGEGSPPPPSSLDGAPRRWLTASSSQARGSLAMVALLTLGCGAAKAFAIADVIGGLGLFWLWCVFTGRPARLLMYGAAVTLLGSLVVYRFMLSGGSAGTLGVHPLDFLTDANTLERARSGLQSLLGHSSLWIVALIAAAPLVATLLFAPILGVLRLLLRRESLSPFLALCICMFAVGVLAYVSLGAPGGVEGVFLVYGYISLLPAAAVGLITLWGDLPSAVRAGMARACGALFALALALALIGSALGSPPTNIVRDGWYVLAYGLVAVTVLVTALRWMRRCAITIPSTLARTIACCVPLLVVLGAVKPATLAAVGAVKTALHRQIAQVNTAADYGMTTVLYQGLVWVRNHTSRCDVLAVSNHRTGPPPAQSVYFYYSAFTERRVFLESWYYTPRGADVAQPYPARYALETEATEHGSPSALRRLARDGVDYVLIDRLHGGGAPEPSSASQLVFENPALAVYRLNGSRPARNCS